MAVDVKAIAKLRSVTGAGMMDAKAALEEAKGDMDKAIEVLRTRGHAKADKKAGRATTAGLVDAYVHMGRVGALVVVNCETDFVAKTDEFKTFVRDIAMQVTAAHPRYAEPDNIPQDVIEKEKKIYADEVKDKPAEVAEKIIEGKLAKFYEQVCLFKQPFIKDDSKTIEEYLKETIAKLGENIVIAGFSRRELGANHDE